MSKIETLFRLLATAEDAEVIAGVRQALAAEVRDAYGRKAAERAFLSQNETAFLSQNEILSQNETVDGWFPSQNEILSQNETTPVENPIAGGQRSKENRQ